jgi:hypothetical protein
VEGNATHEILKIYAVLQGHRSLALLLNLHRKDRKQLILKLSLNLTLQNTEDTLPTYNKHTDLRSGPSQVGIDTLCCFAERFNRD